MSYGALDARANAYAHWALSLGLKQGDAVALFMDNRPDFLCAWLGLFKAGLCAALINTNQRGQPLAHSIQIAGARHVIAGEELAACLPEAEPFFDVKPQIWIQGEKNNLDTALDAAPTFHRAPVHAPASPARTAPFIFTPPAPPACPRPPISAICACCS